jgi:DNA repair ATPase RecN
MARATRPVSLRLAPHHIQQLKTRAFTVSGTLTGVARELILTGLAGGDNKALAERLMQIERRLVTLESLARDVSGTAERIEAVAKDLRAKLHALLAALSSAEGAE